MARSGRKALTTALLTAVYHLQDLTDLGAAVLSSQLLKQLQGWIKDVRPLATLSARCRALCGGLTADRVQGPYTNNPAQSGALLNQLLVLPL